MSHEASAAQTTDVSNLPYFPRLWEELKKSVVQEPVPYALYDLALKLLPVTVSSLPVVGIPASAMFLSYSFFIDAAIAARFDAFTAKINSFFDTTVAPVVKNAGVSAKQAIKKEVVQVLLS